jgi:4-diphosphocytidyl-2-C-methyl-D-erythritol kinase
MPEITVPSPGKINLFLHINGRRPDGYHLLQTAFQFIDFSDYLTFTLRSDSKIHLQAPSLAFPVEQNLIYRAATLLQRYTQCNKGVDIALEKHLPMGGGLGGGSSNAATTLVILNLLWETQLSDAQLLTLGLELGADVPIFIDGRASFAQGIGEELTPTDFPEKWLLLLLPSCHVDTGKIFSDSQLTRNTPPITIAEFFEDGGHNDCEPVAKKHFPEIANALSWLGRYASVRMTGTGSCVFAIFEDKEAALHVIKQIPDSLRGIIVRGLNSSPLHNAINNLIGVSPSGKARGFDLRIPRFES